MSGDDIRSRKLSIALLRYFQVGHTLSRLSAHAADFPGYTADELKDASRGLIASGFIKLVRGRTKASLYLRTSDGDVVLNSLEELEDQAFRVTGKR